MAVIHGVHDNKRAAVRYATSITHFAVFVYQVERYAERRFTLWRAPRTLPRHTERSRSPASKSQTMPDSQPKPKPLVLIDGSHYMFRAFHAMPSLNNAAGEPTGAAYGLVNMLRKILAEYQPERMAFRIRCQGQDF